MRQVFEVTLDDVDDTVPWTEAQFKGTIEVLMDGETVEVKEIKNG